MTEKEKLGICGLGVRAGVLTLNVPLVLFSGFMTGVVKLSVFLSPK
jgi:hypothetical protein